MKQYTHKNGAKYRFYPVAEHSFYADHVDPGTGQLYFYTETLDNRVCSIQTDLLGIAAVNQYGLSDLNSSTPFPIQELEYRDEFKELLHLIVSDPNQLVLQLT